MLDLHQNSIAVSKLVATGFNKRRLLWEDLKHELSFVDQDKRTGVCLASLTQSDAAIGQLIEDTHGSSGSDLKLIDLLLSLQSMLKSAGDQFREVPEVKAYSAWVWETGVRSSEYTTPQEQLEDYLKVVRELRRRTYPIWSSLIDLLPDGLVRTEAESKFASGLKSVGLDSLSVEPDWVFE